MLAPRKVRRRRCILRQDCVISLALRLIFLALVMLLGIEWAWGRFDTLLILFDVEERLMGGVSVDSGAERADRSGCSSLC